MDGFISAVGTQDAENSESAEALYQQAAMEYANATGEPYDSCPSDGRSCGKSSGSRSSGLCDRFLLFQAD